MSPFFRLQVRILTYSRQQCSYSSLPRTISLGSYMRVGVLAYSHKNQAFWQKAKILDVAKSAFQPEKVCTIEYSVVNGRTGLTGLPGTRVTK